MSAQPDYKKALLILVGVLFCFAVLLYFATNSSAQSALLFADGVSTDKDWSDESGGFIYRDRVQTGGWDLGNGLIDDSQLYGGYGGYHLIEEFDSAAGFTSTHPQYVYVDEAHSWAVLNVSRTETRLLFRTIPDLTSGDFRLRVKGQMNSSNNNCWIHTRISDGVPHLGTFTPSATINFAWFGGGCPNNFYHIRANWAYPNGQGYQTHQGYECGGSNGTIIPIDTNTPYTAVLNILSSQNSATLSVFDMADNLIGSLTGPAGFEPNFGTLDTLSLGMVAANDFPSCSGTIDSVTIEMLSRIYVPYVRKFPG